MACKCVNDEGAPALGCDGTCSSENMYNPESQIRAQEDAFTNKQLDQLSQIVRSSLRHTAIMNEY